MRQGGTPRLWIALIRTQIKSLIFLISIGMLFILSQSGLASIYIYKVVCVCVCVSPHLLRDDWTDMDQILYVTYVLLSHLK